MLVVMSTPSAASSAASSSASIAASTANASIRSPSVASTAPTDAVDGLPVLPRLALVGDRSDRVAAHRVIPDLVGSAPGAGASIEAYWLHSTSITGPGDLAGFDGIWAIPGSPYASEQGVLAAITAARTAAIPFLGTCGGFQHLLLEYARNVCGLQDAGHTESDPDAAVPLIVPLECSLLGEEAMVHVVAGTLAARVMGAGATTERYFCRYGLSAAFVDILTRHGLVVSGRDEQGDVRIAELESHPFFLGTLFQPELSSDATWVHPVVAAFLAAVRAHAQARRRSPLGS